MYLVINTDSAIYSPARIPNDKVSSFLSQETCQTPTTISTALSDSREFNKPVKVGHFIAIYYHKQPPEVTAESLKLFFEKEEAEIKSKTLVSKALKPKSLSSFKPATEAEKEAKAPKEPKGTKARSEHPYSLNDLSEKIGVDTKKIRKTLRKLGIKKEGSSYGWPSEEEAIKQLNEAGYKI